MGALSVRHYLRRIIGKTAILFAASFHVGASESGGDELRVRFLRRIGYNIGVGFQIIDDILDIAGNTRTTGKPTGTDLRQGVVTLPVILALQTSTNGRRQELERLIRRSVSGIRPIQAGMIGRAAKVVEASGALSGAQEIAARYTERALREISHLPEGAERESLTEITERLLARAS
jgi:heptaprenyl diphosphate synthase